MAWETRKNGRRYFYLSERRPDGSVRKRYLGNGMRAEVESIRLELDQERRARRAQERQEAAELGRLTDEAAQSSLTLLEAHYYAAGLYNPKSRGWRRRRDMTKTVKKESQEKKSEEAASPGETGPPDLRQLVSLARGGDEQAALQIRALLKKEPDLFGPVGQLNLRVQYKWILTIAGSDLFLRETLRSYTNELRASLLEEGGGPAAGGRRCFAR